MVQNKDRGKRMARFVGGRSYRGRRTIGDSCPNRTDIFFLCIVPSTRHQGTVGGGLLWD
jgi:hypothetical protein